MDDMMNLRDVRIVTVGEAKTMRAPIFDDDYEEALIFNDDQFEEESMPVYDTDIEDVIEEEEGFVGKGGFGEEEENMEDVTWKRMDSGNDKKARTDLEVDRLSSLPDDLIHKILSFVDIKDAVETSALSSRWRFIWTRLPYLNFSTESFSTSHMFSKFVTHVLSRNGETDLFSVKLIFREKFNQVLIKRILNNALSRNVQQLRITFLHRKCKMQLPLLLLNSESLKHLSLKGSAELNTVKLTSIWHLPALTTLNLYYLNLDNCHSVLALSPNLKNLNLNCCQVIESDGFCITNSQLLTLTLEDVKWHVKFVRVDTPQLKNLSDDIY
ncbi:putative leucine-rich repeat domain-like protein [Tanacetum coccineum]